MALITTGFRKQVVLYLLAVILPCAALVAVTYRMIQQEQELARNEAAEECNRLAREIGGHLLARLQNMELQEVDAITQGKRSSFCREYENRETVLIAQINEGRLVLPWDGDSRVKKAQQSLTQESFAVRIRSGEDEEFIRKDFLRASDHYRRCMDASLDPVQKGYATVLLARALNKADRMADALSRYREILEMPLALVDEHGIPIFLYAVKPLIRSGEGLDYVFEVLKELLVGKYWLSPAAVYFVEDAIQEIVALRMGDSIEVGAVLLQEEVRERERFFQAAADLQQQFPSMGLMGDSGSPQPRSSSAWVSFSAQRWLVGSSHGGVENAALCIVVDGTTTMDVINNEIGQATENSVQIAWNPDDVGDMKYLGSNFRNLGVRFSPDFVSSLVKQHSPQRVLYGLLLLLVMSLTLFGGYLVWRDVRREVRLAEMRSQFVSSVSHELKTPLTAILMFAETMRMGRLKDAEVQREYLETIINESQRLTRLLNNVLDFSKIEQGKRQYNMEAAPLSGFVQAAARTMVYPLSQKGFRLKVHIDPGLPNVHMDGDAMEQAVLNLLSNAMKYSENSSVIDLKLTRDDDCAIIQVADHGIGIKAEEQERIFEKFYRVQAGNNNRSAGTGLGLALVSHIVTAHGGRIEVDSKPGEGSTFSIYLPFGETS
ncbi:MAG: HAMP domain-containing histidine kinase [Gemmatimonadales bacterium]|nr:HAMP domain-containing histidine kinase [Gemmatimonadales bacterium]